MGDELRGIGEKTPPPATIEAVVEERPDGRRVVRLALPGPLAELQRDLPALRRLPCTFRRIVLTAAGRTAIDFRGNYVMIMRMAGVVSNVAELRIKAESEGAEWISIQGEMILPLAFTKLYLWWDAIANGEVDILLGTALL